MQFLTSLLGGADNPLINSAFALGIVLVLIVLGVWVLKLFTNAGQTLTRGPRKRLSVIDTAMVDNKRKVVIIRRDNVEHVIMTGGPQDLVIESGVPVVEPAPRRPAARPQPKRPTPSTPVPEPDIATPVAPDHSVSREAIDRLRDLARPAPLKPRNALIPTGPSLRIDNSAGPASDSARTATGDSASGQSRFVGRNRFFRSVTRGDRP